MRVKWPGFPLGELVVMRSGGTPSRENLEYWTGKIPWFSGKDLKSFFLRDSIEHISPKAVGKGARLVAAGTLLVLVRGMTLMKEVPVGITMREASFNQDVKALVPHGHKAEARFLGYYLRSENQRIKNCVTTAGHGTGRLPLESLEEYPVSVPPLAEQRKIADILGTWDEALEKLDALIAAKQRRKQALMQQLLTGRKRLNRFESKWSVANLGDLIRPNIRPVGKPTEPFLSAGIRSHNRGVFLKLDFKPGDIALDELFELKAGDLVVNITVAWEGALAIVPPEADGALVSHRFPTFEFLPGSAAVGFFGHLIQTKRFVFHCGLASPGGAGRNRVLSKTEFLKIPVSVPSFVEQAVIGGILDACDEELRLLRNQRDALDRQKRGLMQWLLTGKIRVKVSTAGTE